MLVFALYDGASVCFPLYFSCQPISWSLHWLERKETVTPRCLIHKRRYAAVDSEGEGVSMTLITSVSSFCFRAPRTESACSQILRPWHEHDHDLPFLPQAVIRRGGCLALSVTLARLLDKALTPALATTTWVCKGRPVWK